jgi:hypothetical protein
LIRPRSDKTDALLAKNASSSGARAKARKTRPKPTGEQSDAIAAGTGKESETPRQERKAAARDAPPRSKRPGDVVRVVFVLQKFRNG